MSKYRPIIETKYEIRVKELEAEGLTTSDAQGVADGELMIADVKALYATHEDDEQEDA